MDFWDAFAMLVEHELAGEAFGFSMVDWDVRAVAFLETFVPVLDVVQGFAGDILKGSSGLEP